ncbi:MAG: hypothetical protein HY052_05335, partial [Proteobacteria bacterium]|nr:hypothetical protein [Pseudomonadota bacterium]
MNACRQHGVGKVAVALAVFVYIVCGAFDPAYAAPPPIDASCKGATNYGLTAGLVFCILSSLGVAVDTYLPPLQTFLAPYKDLALVVAVAIFGLKLMSSQIK